MTDPRDRPPLTWTKVKVVKSLIDNLAIQIQKSDGPWPHRYSIQMMRNLGPDPVRPELGDRLAPFFSVRIDRDGSLVRISKMNTDALDELVLEAEEWVREDAQKALDARNQRRV